MPKVELPHELKDGDIGTGKKFMENYEAIVEAVNNLDEDNFTDNSVTDTIIGERTVDETEAPSGNTGVLTAILSWLANRIKAITGATHWYSDPAISLASTKAHVDANTNVHGVGASTVESASGAQARVDTHSALTTGVHGVGASTVESAAGAQAKVDAHANRTDNPHNVTAQQAGALVSINSIANPGGDVSLVAGSGITITPLPDSKQVKVTATGESVPIGHASEHAIGGSDVLTPAAIGAETPDGAQAKADAAEAAAKAYADDAAEAAAKAYADDAAGAVQAELDAHVAESAIHKTSDVIRTETETKLKVEVVSSSVTETPDAGRIIFDTSQGKFFGGNGTEWV